MNRKSVLIEAKARIVRDAGFRLICEPEAGSSRKRFFFISTSGSRVATDELGAKIWEALPGTRAEIGPRLREGVEASGGGLRLDLADGMLEKFLFILIRAGILQFETRETANGLSSFAPKRPAEMSGPAEPLPVSGLPRGGAPSVSVVIVTYNSAAHIRGCLASLAGQTFIPAEILVVDNASSDDTLEIVRREFPGAVVHPLRRNRYYPGGLNYGIGKSSGAYILLLNDDIELQPDALAEMVRVLEARPEAAAAAPMLKFYDLPGFLNGLGNHVRPTGWGSDNLIGSVDVGQFADIREVPSACVSAMLLRREAWRDVGRFDASFQAFYEDPDWCFRARLRGWTIAAAPAAVVRHKFNAHWRGRSSRFRRASRNRLRFVIKNFRGRLLWAFLRSYVKEDVRTALSIGRKGRVFEAAAYIGAYISLAIHFPGDLRKRFRIQKGRKPGASIENILALNPVPWTCLNDDNLPKIDASTYFEYYRRLFEPRAEEER